MAPIAQRWLDLWQERAEDSLAKRDLTTDQRSYAAKIIARALEEAKAEPDAGVALHTLDKAGYALGAIGSIFS